MNAGFELFLWNLGRGMWHLKLWVSMKMETEYSQALLCRNRDLSIYSGKVEGHLRGTVKGI